MTSSELRAFIGLFTTVPHSSSAGRRDTARGAERRFVRQRTADCAAVAALCLALGPGGLVAAPGDLDTTFGTGGVVLTDGAGITQYDRGQSLAVQTDGKILLAGHSDVGINDDFALLRYNPDGSLDPTFGTGGKVFTDGRGAANNDQGYGVTVQPDGKILVTGYSYNGSSLEDSTLLRYSADGTLDATFGTGGKVLTDVGEINESDYGMSVAVQSDGKILVAGFSETSTSLYDFALVRYNTDGSLDTTFGTSGIALTDVTGLNRNDYGYSVAIQPDGKILVAGRSHIFGPDYDFALVRYNSDGSLDTTFGTSGKVLTDVADDYGRSVTVQADGKILVAGRSYTAATDDDFALLRYNTDGSLDTTFGTGGVVLTDVAGINSADFGFNVAARSDGKLLITGYSNVGTHENCALVRYNTDGSLDTTFGTGGKVLADVAGTSGNDRSHSVIVQTDGKIIVAGNSQNSSDYDFSLLRYEGDVPAGDMFGSGGNTFYMEFVEVGDAGNPDDSGTTGSFHSPYGGVDYTYRIGVLEVSELMIAKANNLGGLGITLDGRGMDKPATNVSWNEAARFVNWLNTSKGYPAAYKFALQPGEPGYSANANILLWDSGDSGYNPANPYRNANAYYFLPSEDEWYKAAFYSGTGTIYYDYAQGSDSAPTPIAGGTASGTAVYTQPAAQGPTDVYRAGGLSPYGTMGQGGNIWEWMESSSNGLNNAPAAGRVVRGGDWTSGQLGLRSSPRNFHGPTVQDDGFGFRVASVSPQVPLDPPDTTLLGLGSDFEVSDGAGGLTSLNTIKWAFLNKNGDSVFCGGLRRTGSVTFANDLALWKPVGGTPEVIARERGAADGGGASTYKSFRESTIGDSGKVFFPALIHNRANLNGFWLANGTTELVAQRGVGGVKLLRPAKHASDGEDSHVYQAQLALGGGVSRANNTVYNLHGTGTLVQESNLITGVTGAKFGEVTAIPALATSAGGDPVALAFRHVMKAAVTGSVTGANNQAVLTADPSSLPGGDFDASLREGDTAPTGDAVLPTIRAFMDPRVNRGRDVACVAVLNTGSGSPVVKSSNNRVILAKIGSTVHVVARKGSQAADAGAGVNYLRFKNVMFTNSGHVYFRAMLQGTGINSTNNEGLYAWDEGGGTRKVVRKTDAAADTSVQVKAIQRVAVNNLGDAAYQVQLTGAAGGNQALYLYDYAADNHVLAIRKGTDLESPDAASGGTVTRPVKLIRLGTPRLASGPNGVPRVINDDATAIAVLGFPYNIYGLFLFEQP